MHLYRYTTKSMHYSDYSKPPEVDRAWPVYHPLTKLSRPYLMQREPFLVQLVFNDILCFKISLWYNNVSLYQALTIYNSRFFYKDSF